MNYHITIDFVDGTTWLARIRRFNATSPPALRDYILRSEAATLRFLEGTAVPAPKLFDYALEGETDIGIGYMLIEKLPGSTLAWGAISPDQETKVLQQLADIFIELRTHPFDKMGSLDSPGSSHVGPVARELMADFDPDERMQLLGPFASSREYYCASVRLVLDLIVRGELYPHRAVDAYLIHLFLLEHIPLALPQDTDDVFYVNHVDDRGDHILVDTEHNITGIIDWEWAHTAPARLAFSSPTMLLNVADSFDGSTHLSGHEEFARILEEKGYSDLGECVRRGRVQHFFTFCCEYDDSWMGWDAFLELFRGFRGVVGDYDRYAEGEMDWVEWRDWALDRYADDEGVFCKAVQDN